MWRRSALLILMVVVVGVFSQSDPECDGVCYSSGDPHYQSFDCKRFEFQGQCSYTLMKSCDESLLHFEVITDNEPVPYHPDYTYTKSILLKSKVATAVEFNGNSDRETHVENMFDSPVQAQFIRLKPTAWNGHISLRFDVLGLDSCQADDGENIVGLGLENRNIPDNQITASTSWPDEKLYFGPENARLNRPKKGSTTGAWSAEKNDLDQWIQVDLGCVKQVSGVVTQGRNDYNQWVTKYNVQYSVDGESWSFVMENAENVEFNGNSDRGTHVENMFNSPVQAQFIRLLPTAWFGYISLRFDVLGIDACQADDGENIVGLGLENRNIPDNQITASTSWPDEKLYFGPENARLNRPKKGSTTGAWSAEKNDLDQWIQVDLGCVKQVSGVVTQGRNDYNQWVTKYNVQYSVDGESWSFVMENAENVEFNGNSDRGTHVENIFNSPVQAQFIRLLPTAWFGYISLRFDVLGIDACQADDGENIVGLGLENKNIPDNQITASTSWPDEKLYFGPENARLNRPKQGSTTGAWSAEKNDLDQWIQVDLGCVKQVLGVVTQGRNDYNQWVTKYNVQYSVDGESWSFVMENAENEIRLTGNREIFVNGEKQDAPPISTDIGSITIVNDVIVVKTIWQFTLSYGSPFKITISLDGKQLPGKICGICGNANGDPADDFKKPDNEVVDDINLFGESWKVEENCRGLLPAGRIMVE